MHVSLVGINFLKVPVTLREKVAISSTKLPESLSLLRTSVPYGVILSTCNRTEIYTIDDDALRARESCLAFFKKRLNGSDFGLLSNIYMLEDEAAVEHLFRVASSLESMIIGECEVLGQVKIALRSAQKAGMVNLALEYVFQSAIRIGRRIRDKTSISKNAVSISSLALDLATKVVGDLSKCKLLVIGAGEAGKLVAKIALSRGISKLVIANRTYKRAKSLAVEIGGIPVGHESVMEQLADTNIVVTCSGAPHKTLDIKRVKKVMNIRSGVPLVIIDIGVPRNVEFGVGLLDNVSLHTIDDLIQLSENNRAQREDEVHKAEKLISEEIGKFSIRWRSFLARPLVKSLTDKAESIRSLQLKKSIRKLRDLSFDEQTELEAMTKSIVARILHEPLTFLKTVNGNECHETIRKIFQLDSDKLS